MQQVLPPGVENGEEADLGAEMFGIAGYRKQGLGGGAKENAVDFTWVVESDLGDGFGDGEDNVEVFDGEQLGFAGFQPAGSFRILALRAVPVSARVIRITSVRAMAALFDVAAENGRAADLDGAHDARLSAREGPRGAEGFSETSKDGGQLEGRPGHGYFLGGRAATALPVLGFMRSSGLMTARTADGVTAV